MADSWYMSEGPILDGDHCAWTAGNGHHGPAGGRVNADLAEYGDLMRSDPDALLAAVEALGDPLTVDELTDRLIIDRDLALRARDIEVWGDIHEILWRVLLPRLDSAGFLHFDSDRGEIWRNAVPEER